MYPAAALMLALCLAPRSAAISPPQRVSFRADDGVTLAASWYPAASRPAPAVILVHMLHKSRRDWDSCASRLAAEGIGALAIDLRGHGESQGSVVQDFAPMVLDLRAARRFLASSGEVAAGRLGIAGASIGANLAALEAADDPAIASVALLSPSLDYRGLRIEAAVRKYGARPMLLVASDDDPYAARSVRELLKPAPGAKREAAGATRERMILSGAGHGTTMLLRDSGLERALVDWFRRTLL